MENLQLPEVVQQWATVVLVWIGFGTLVGLLAKAIMPGRDPGGAVIGCGILAFFVPAMRVKPISVVRFVVATAGAFILLFFCRLLAGYFFVEGDRVHRRTAWPRRVDSPLIDD